MDTDENVIKCGSHAHSLKWVLVRVKKAIRIDSRSRNLSYCEGLWNPIKFIKEKLSGNLIMIYKCMYVEISHGSIPSNLADKGTTQYSVLKMKPVKFRIERKYTLTAKVIKHWNNLPRVVEDSQSL